MKLRFTELERFPALFFGNCEKNVKKSGCQKKRYVIYLTHAIRGNVIKSNCV